MIRSFSLGFMAPFRGLKVYRNHPRTLGWALMPTLINVLLFWAIYWWIGSWIGETIQGWFAEAEGWMTFFLWVTLGFALLVLFGVCGLLIAVVARIVAFPFNDPLALSVEKAIGIADQGAGPTGFKEQFKELLKDLGREIRKALALLAVAIIVAGLGLIPGLGLFLWPITAFLLAFDFLDYPLARRGMGFSSQLSFMMKNLGASLGFGVAISLLVPLPILGFFFLPVAVAGGTELYSHLKGREA
jgi:CysZ protein